jgi:hypothetical protein
MKSTGNLGVCVWLLTALMPGCSGDDVGPPLCIPGEVVECLCAEGEAGIQLCLESGRYERCACTALTVGRPASGNGGDGGRGGGMSDPPEPEEPPPDDPPEQEPPGGDDAEPAEDGELWGACRDGGDCRNNLECTGNNSEAFGGSEVGYCTQRCIGSSGPGSNNRRDCTPPDSGTVEVICSPLSTLCELGSCQDASCPAGMRCQELDTPFGTSFECGYQ